MFRAYLFTSFSNAVTVAPAAAKKPLNVVENAAKRRGAGRSVVPRGDTKWIPQVRRIQRTGDYPRILVVDTFQSSNLGILLVSLWEIAVLLPPLGVMVRRLRDANYGRKNIFWILVPIAGLIVLVIYWLKPS